jgi:hypothetical protein
MLNKQAIFFFAVSTIVSLLIVHPVSAQDDPPPELCPAFTVETLETIATQCSEIDPNQVCYGAGDVTAMLRNTSTVDDFSSPGDTLDIADVYLLELSSPMPEGEPDEAVKPSVAIARLWNIRDSAEAESRQTVDIPHCTA